MHTNPSGRYDTSIGKFQLAAGRVSKKSHVKIEFLNLSLNQLARVESVVDDKAIGI